MASGRRFLRPVRMPVPPHPHEEPQAVKQGGRLVVSSGRPRGLPLGPCGLEPRLAAGLEHHDLCRALRLLGACRDPDEVQLHFLSSL
jgi:hypothetical protein